MAWPDEGHAYGPGKGRQAVSEAYDLMLRRHSHGYALTTQEAFPMPPALTLREGSWKRQCPPRRTETGIAWDDVVQSQP